MQSITELKDKISELKKSELKKNIFEEYNIIQIIEK
jgi:hypothetical protein